MRFPSLSRCSTPALSVIVFLGFSGSALASNGGAAQPSATGGAQVGTPQANAQKRPVVKTFRATPTRVASGRLPKLAVRIDQRAVATVDLRIALVRVGRRNASVTLTIPDAPTGKLLSPKWPTTKNLTPGRYIVRVHARSADGATLKRTARAAGRMTIVVYKKPRPTRSPRPAPKADPAPTPTGTGVFPVQGPHTYGSGGGSFGAGRTGHTHEGQDIAAERGIPVVAPLAGTIITADYQRNGAGYYVAMDAEDGHAFFFAHCRKDTVVVVRAQAVTAGQRICDVGNTGDSTGPHLHFEIWIGGWRRDKHSRPIDPLEQLRIWDR